MSSEEVDAEVVSSSDVGGGDNAGAGGGGGSAPEESGGDNISSSDAVISSSSSSAPVDGVTVTPSGKSADEGVFAQPFRAPAALPPPKFVSPKSSSSSGGVSSSSSSPSKDPSTSAEQQQRRQERKERQAKEKLEKYQQILSSLKYTPPKYAAPCADTRYNFEVLKTGTIVDNVKFSSFDRKGYYIIGRVPGCDIVAENPTVSRMHAILQFIQCPKEETKLGEDSSDSPQESGLYLYDLNSTHGTFLNKNQLFPHRFYRVHVGHVIKFGSSQRMYIVNGPDDDEEVESDKSVTELQNERLKKELERKRVEEEEQLKRAAASGSTSKLPSENIEVEGINWGMAEDADEESDMRVNPFAIDYDTSELSLDNPKKTLRSWFEREGHDLEYEIREKGNGQYVCRIGLPLDGPTGDGLVYAESEVRGKKKEAAADCAMKACQILDSHGVLRTSNQESRKRKEKKWEDEDYYSSDEDTFLDRTGSIERKRQKRMRLAGKADGASSSDGVMTYDSLCSKHAELEKEIAELKEKIEKSEEVKQRADDGDVDIDDYMNLLKSGVFDVKKLKGRLKVAQEEIGRTKKLMNIAKPAELPAYLQMKPGGDPSKLEEKKAAPASSTTTEPESQSKNEAESTTAATPSSSSSPPKFTPSRKPVVGPMKPPPSALSTAPAKPKVFGLITPDNFAALKASKIRAPPSEVTTSTKVPSEDEDDEAAFQEEDDEPSSEEEEATPAEAAVAAEEEEDVPEFAKPAKKKRQRYRKNKGKGGGGGGGVQSYQDDPDYSEWVPPVGQSGDGRTSLNEKLGY